MQHPTPTTAGATEHATTLLDLPAVTVSVRHDAGQPTAVRLDMHGKNNHRFDLDARGAYELGTESVRLAENARTDAARRRFAQTAIALLTAASLIDGGNRRDQP